MKTEKIALGERDWDILMGMHLGRPSPEVPRILENIQQQLIALRAAPAASPS